MPSIARRSAGNTVRDAEVAMFEDRARVLLILPQEVLDRARVFAGESMTKLKGPVSLQMVLRALIDEGLKRERDRALLANVEGQMRAVRELRSRGRRLAATPRPAKLSPRASGRRG
jgi:hypothetical protein